MWGETRRTVVEVRILVVFNGPTFPTRPRKSLSPLTGPSIRRPTRVLPQSSARTGDGTFNSRGTKCLLPSLRVSPIH